jgi:hypothetical protein
VVAIDTAAVIYCGPRLWSAAMALEPGTCHGQAANAKEALIWARMAARQIREASTKLEIRNPKQIQNSN